MTALTVTAKGQITIRKALLEGLGAKPGDRLEIVVRPDGGIFIPPLRRKTRSWDEIAGMLKRPKGVAPVSIEEMNETIAKGWAGQLSDDA